MTVPATSPFPTKRLKHVVSLRRSRVDGSEDGRPYVGLENIDSWTGALLGEFSTSTNLEGTSLSNTFEPGDVLFGKLRPYLAKVWVAEFAGRSTTECLVMKPVEVEPRFLGYVCVNRDFVDAVTASAFGSKMPRADWDFIGNMPVPVPEWRKQLTIADYLDRETTRLDALIAAKERMLALLSERRQALITKTVTRDCGSTEPQTPLVCSTLLTEESQNGYEAGRSGNNASAAGRDAVNRYSYIRRCRLKYVATINDDVLNEDTDDDYELQYIDIGNVYASGSALNPVTYQFKNAPNRARRRVRNGDIIISCVRTYLQAIAQIMTPPANLVVSTGFAVVRPSTAFLNPNFANYALREPSFLAEIKKRSIGVSYPAINASDLADISIHLPPLCEQRAIADYLDRKTTRLDSLVAEIKVTISLLKERRAALIAAVVNGQHDMGEAA